MDTPTPRRGRLRSAARVTAKTLDQRRADFLRRYGFTEEQFKQTGLEWEVLDQIRKHHTGMLQELQTTAAYVVERLQTVPEVHSLKSRIKDADHLVAKAIRKRSEDRDIAIDCTTYENSITDLVGVRVLHLFKDDWRPIHDFVNATWELHEEPIAYVRGGDGVPRGFADAGCRVKTHPFGYRSIHYTIRSQPAKCVRLVELQVRTIFEEGWSEIDHKVRYPRQSNDPELSFLLAIFNRLAGSADEMGTFTKILASKAKESARQIQEKEAELKKTISQLEITKEEKLSLQRQVAEINKPPQTAGSNALLGSGVGGIDLSKLYDPAASLTFSFSRICSVCDKAIPTGNATAYNLLAPPLCPDCTSRLRRPLGT
jgi:putative GTP pyrophosphokinase